jgi:hypothetical protein
MQVRIIIVLLVAALPCMAGVDEVSCDRLIAVGDLHGGYEDFITILKETGLIDDGLRWVGGENCLVQEGDILDRGKRPLELLDFIMKLQPQAPERIRVLLGNHEIMNMTGDLRYVSPLDFQSFAAEETSAERTEGFQQFLKTEMAAGLDASSALEAFDREFPAGWFAHRRAFAPDGRYGSWLLERPTVIKIAGYVFVHGGLTVADARSGMKVINRRVREGVLDYHELREELEGAGWLHPLMASYEAFSAVTRRLDRTLKVESPWETSNTLAKAKQFLELLDNPAFRRDGPLWHRDFAEGCEEEFTDDLKAVLKALHAKRLVLSHTVTEGNVIQTRFNYRVFLINTGAGHAYGEHVSALEISWTGRVRAIYPGKSEALVGVPRSDEVIEYFLREGEVIHSEEIGRGISRPKKLVLELRGEQEMAAFKTIDVEEMRRLRFQREGYKLHFTDRWAYDHAAYLLDRYLGMNMIPVTVVREVGGETGAVIQWVSDAISEADRREQGLEPPDPRRLDKQREIMRVFDGLILNDDRNLGNELITTHDWKLHLIDHSRSFRILKTLPKGFGDEPIGLPRSLYESLKTMELQGMQKLFDSLLTKTQVKALLVRRDKLIEEIEKDRLEYGDELVFH